MSPLELIPVQYRAVALAGAFLFGVTAIYASGHHKGYASAKLKYETKIAQMIADSEHARAEAVEAVRRADAAQLAKVKETLEWQATKAQMHASSFAEARAMIRKSIVAGADSPAHPVILQAVRRGK